MGLLLLAFVLEAADAPAHGGRYRPPAGGYRLPGDVPRPPSDPTPDAPTATGPATPTAPATPAAPTTPSAPAPAPGITPGGPAAMGAGTSAPASGGGAALPETEAWSTWWEYNRDRYLQLPALTRVPLAVTPGHPEGAGGSVGPPVPAARRALGPVLEALLGDRSSVDLQSAGLLALARAATGPAASARILPFLKSANQEISETAALALGALRAPHLVSTLEALLADTEEGARLVGRDRVPWRTREFAAYGLALLARSTGLEGIRERVAGILLDHAENGRSASPTLEEACVIALAQIPLADAEEELERLLELMRSRRKNAPLRGHLPTAAARLLGNAPTAGSRMAEGWLDLCLGLLEDGGEPDSVRLASVQALGWMPLDPESEARVMAVLAEHAGSEGHASLRNQALLSLGLLASRGGPAAQTIAMPFLLEALATGPNQERGWAALSLGVMGFEARARGGEVPGLVGTRLRDRLGQERNPSVRAAVATALGLLADSRAAGPLARLLEEDRNPELQGYVAVALGLLGHEDATKTLRAMLRSARRKPDLLRSLAEGLTLLRDPQATEELVALLGRRQQSLPVTAAVASALGATRNFAAVEPLLELLQDQDATDLARAFSAAALGLLADRDELPFRARFALGLNYRAAPETIVDPAGLAGLLNLL